MSLHIAELAPLPVGVMHGVGGKLGDRLYAGLGSAGQQFFCFDLSDPTLGWQAAPDFPGVARNDAVFAVCDDKLYVFSGAGVEREDQSPVVLTDGYVFDPISDGWLKLDTQIPVGLLGASACSMSPGQLQFWGGYCKETFDSFLAQISQIDAVKEPEVHRELLTEFMSRPIPAYGWNKEIWQFDTETCQWRILDQNPFAANCGAGLIKHGDQAVLIEGEVKPGLRSLETKVFCFDGGKLKQSHVIAPISTIHSGHDGLAGHYAALLGEHYLVAGGAYFVGSQENYRQHQLYSHKGLTKHYDDAIWLYDGVCWETAGTLPKALAYGLSLSDGSSVYLIGGEDAKGQAVLQCFNLYRQ